MKDNILILLPDEISILRDLENQGGIPLDHEQYNIYYKNLIYPYKEEWDIQISCAYGANMGDMWRIERFPNGVESFPLTVSVYEEYGHKLAEKSCTVRILKKSGRDISLLCIGDSMTQDGVYIEHAANKLKGLRTIGIRRSGFIWHEGRGGWRCEDFFWRIGREQEGGRSPFLFPEGIPAKQYYGSRWMKEAMDSGHENEYGFVGLRREEIGENQYYLQNNELVHSSSGERIAAPKFVFDFAGYLERYGFDVPDVVSVLFGANEFQTCPYQDMPAALDRYMQHMDAMIGEIKKVSSRTAVIVNLPVLGSDQYSWGSKLGCRGSAKQYEHNIKMACRALLEKYDKRRDEKIFISPMLLTCSPFTGFELADSRENLYTDFMVRHGTNWVHPSITGYRQMGTALAGAVERAVLTEKNTD
ncbi:MAG: SGNH/GDSL hydrolase family protein [Clostridia bacterium]|nr:SGNH/GDSL hydrolase family protein [Clostridia bacterium]